MAMSSFRRSVTADTKKPAGKGFRGGFFDKWRFPKDSATPLMLIDAEYIDPAPSAEEVETDPMTGRALPVKHAYYKVKKHRRKMFKNGKEWFADEVCSAGHDPHNPQKCVGCHAMDSGDKTVTVGNYFVFGLVHLHPYHGHPVLDDNGQVRMRSDGKGPLENFDECAGRTCNYCKVLNGQAANPMHNGKPWPGWRADQLTTVFGQRKYIEIGKGHLGNLGGWDASVSSTCGADGAELLVDGYKCPTCQSMVIDMQSDPRSDDQIREAVARPYPCLRCNKPVLLDEVVSCDVCNANNRQHVQHRLFDVVLWGLREGEGTQSKLTLRRFETVEQFANQVHPGFLNGKTLREHIAGLAKPFEFDKMFAPRSLEEQAKRLDLAVPASFQGGGGGQGYQSYGQAPGGYGAPAPAQGGFRPNIPAAPSAPAAPGAPGFVPPGRPNFGNG